MSEDSNGFRDNADHLLSAYYKWKILDKGLDWAHDYATEGSGRGRQAELDALDVKLKRKALGLPMDDDAYQEAVNEDRPFKQTGALAIFGRHVSDVVPERGFLEPKKAQPWANVFREARTEGSSLSSIARNLATRGAEYATPFRRLFR